MATGNDVVYLMKRLRSIVFDSHGESQKPPEERNQRIAEFPERGFHALARLPDDELASRFIAWIGAEGLRKN